MSKLPSDSFEYYLELGADRSYRAVAERYGVLIGTGLDTLRTTTLRIGTMGITASPQYVLPALSALELALRDLGHKAQPGAGVAAAQAAFAEGI